MVRLVVLVFAFTTLSANALFAGERYNFIEAGTGDTLALLEIAALPAFAPDVNSFALTPKAFEFIDFNWGDIWPVELRSPVVFQVFNSASSPGATIVDDGKFGLQSGSNDVVSFNRSVVSPQDYSVALYFHPRPTPADLLDGTDEIEILVGGPPYFASGNWVQASTVPEPSCLLLGSSSLVAWSGFGRARRRWKQGTISPRPVGE